jgi:hypothetical protein
MTTNNLGNNTPQNKISQMSDACHHANSVGLVPRVKNDRLGNASRINPHATAKVIISARMTQATIKKPAGHTIKAGKRERIDSFSKSSRRNMMRKIHQLKGHDTGYFVTLTYPSEWQNLDPTQVKSHIAAFRKRLIRKFPEVGGIWRMELKRRKSGKSTGVLVPHFHVLLFGISPKDIAMLPNNAQRQGRDTKNAKLRRYFAATWNEIVHGDIDHLRAGTQCDKIKNMRHAAAYVSKYAAKNDDDTPNDDEPQFWGRRWGAFGKLDFSPVMTVLIPYQQLPELKRLLRMILIGRSRKREKEAIRDGKEYRHRKNKGYWNAHSMNSDKAGCSILGLGAYESKAHTQIIMMLSQS